MKAALAPIALFTFKRPLHTQRTLASLALNPEFARSELHIFCDGSRRADEDAAVEATREVARRFEHPNKTVHEAPANRGLAASIIDGVGRLCDERGRVIVVEDDLVVAPVFLDFLNRGLDHYQADERVMQVSGHMFAADLSADTGDAVFLPFTTSWGWATWQRAWTHFDPEMRGFERLAGDRALRRRFDLDNAYPYFAMLKKQKAGLLDSWAIRWYLSVFARDGLVLYPRRSLVNNEGFDGSGTNCGVDVSVRDLAVSGVNHFVTGLPDIAIDGLALRRVATLLRAQNTFWQRATRHLLRRFA